jgi:dienelactone hydrolase
LVRVVRNFFSFVLWCCVFASVSGFETNVKAQENLSVLKGWRRYSDAENALYNEIAREAYRFLDNRDRMIEGFRTKEQWQEYIDSVRGKLHTAFGPMPDKTPLNARITGTFEHEGIKVEKIIYESRPDFQVTACLFKRNDLTGKLPAVLYVCGHTGDGFRSPTYQHVILNLAQKGFAVLAIDPVGQGERLQYYDAEKGESLIGGPTSEHSYAGLQYLLIGRTMAMVRLWDGIRAVDYLCERDDIDHERIGVHGRSGGGTMSSFLGAMDNRIAAAAPECYITGFRRLFQSIGPQDAEQNLLGQISDGLDHGDFLIARAPKPTLVVTTTRDFFSIEGAWETFQSVKPAFDAFVLKDNIRLSGNSFQFIEDDAPHQSTKDNRERVYAFFMNVFSVESSNLDEDIPPIDPSLLRVTTTGQVITSGSKAIYDLISGDAFEHIANLDVSRGMINSFPDRYKEKVRTASQKLSGLHFSDSPFEEIFTGRFQRDGYTIEKVIIEEKNGIPIPCLVFVPDERRKHPAVLYLSYGGKEKDAESGGFIESVVQEGYMVLAPDLPGIGELAGDVHNDDSVIRGVDYNLVFGAQLIGRSITGIQAGSIIRVLRYLVSRVDVDADNITAVSRGCTGPALMHAAVFDSAIGSAVFLESPLSWKSLTEHRFYDQVIGSTIVPSALLSYDLPDLIGLIAPRKVLFVDPVDGDGKPACDELIGNINKIVKTLYQDKSGSFDIMKSDRNDTTGIILTEWLKGIE